MRGLFVNCVREWKETMLKVFNLLFHPVHHWLELCVSIQQHQGFQDIKMRLPKLFNAIFTGKMEFG